MAARRTNAAEAEGKKKLMESRFATNLPLAEARGPRNLHRGPAWLGVHRLAAAAPVIWRGLCGIGDKVTAGRAASC